MMQYLLDTNICIFHLRGKLNLNQKLSTEWKKHCCVSEITILELYYGAKNSNDPVKHREAVDLFLKDLDVLPVSSCAEHYAKNKVYLRKTGKPVHDEFDLIIGSTAAAKKIILVTDNMKHFRNFLDIKIENWIEKWN